MVRWSSGLKISSECTAEATKPAFIGSRFAIEAQPWKRQDRGTYKMMSLKRFSATIWSVCFDKKWQSNVDVSGICFLETQKLLGHTTRLDNMITVGT